MNLETTKKVYEYLKNKKRSDIDVTILRNMFPEDLHAFFDEMFAVVDSDLFFISLAVCMTWISDDETEDVCNLMMSYTNYDTLWNTISTKLEVAWTAHELERKRKKNLQ